MDLTPLDPPTETPWIPVDPLHPDLERFPRFKHARPIVVKVQAGDMLYLPGKLCILLSLSFVSFQVLALWFHQVMQHGDEGVIAINAWYDMDYRNTLYPSMSFMRGLVHRCL